MMSEADTANRGWNSAARTDPGARRAHNEDAVLDRAGIGLWCVADGMGGHEAGDVASAAVVDDLRGLHLDPDPADAIDQVDETLMAVNDRLRAWSASELDGRTLGATVVVLLARGALGACLWAGDSRLFRWRGGELQQLSTDHSEVQQLLDSGLIDAREADHHPRASVITRAVGATEQLHADTVLFSVAPGDRFLLCSDGLYNELPFDELERHLADSAGPERVARTLLDAALERGARDNVSVVVADPDHTGPAGGESHLSALNRELRELSGCRARGEIERARYRRMRRALLARAVDEPEADPEDDPTGRHPAIRDRARTRRVLSGLVAAAALAGGLWWLL